MSKNAALPEASHHIRRKVTQNAFRAFDYATDSGRPFELFAVITLRESARYSAATIFQRVRRKFRNWINYKCNLAGLPRQTPAYVATFENPSGALPHVNWALHVPPRYRSEFEQKLPRWVRGAQGEAPRPFDIDVQNVRPGTEKRLAKYLLKGTEPAFVDHFYLRGLYDQHGPQGPVYGRRTIVSVALGASTRREAGWRPRRRPRG